MLFTEIKTRKVQKQEEPDKYPALLVSVSEKELLKKEIFNLLLNNRIDRNS